MEIKCDVLVVGAGASGSVAALECAKNRLDTIIIDKDKHIGESIPERIDITENVGLEGIFKKIGLTVKDRTNRMRWFSPEHSLDVKSKISDLFFKRGSSFDSFEVINVNKAVDKGVELISNAKIEHLRTCGDFIDSIAITAKSDSILLRPKIVIGCDGNNSVILKEFAPKLKPENHSKMLAYGVMGHNLEIEPLATHIFFDALKLPGGYFYLVKLSDGLGVACIVLEKSRTNNPPRHYFERFIKGNNFLKESFRNFKPIKNFEGFGLIDSVKKRGIGNVMLAGDAGRVMDPLFGYGMGNSIISGYSAADIASFSIKEGDPQFVEQYDKTLLSNIPNLENNYEIRGRYNKLRNDDFNRIFLGLLEGREPNRVEFSEDVRPLLDAFSSIMH